MEDRTIKEAYFFPRRFFNPAFFGLSGSGVVLIGLAWYTFVNFPSLWGAGISLVLIMLAVANLLAILKQPRSIKLDDEAFEIHYPLNRSRTPYSRVERLHWRRATRGFGSRAKDTLLIETKDGNWHKLDYMRGRLKKIRGIIEARVYGKTL